MYVYNVIINHLGPTKENAMCRHSIYDYIIFTVKLSLYIYILIIIDYIANLI